MSADVEGRGQPATGALDQVLRVVERAGNRLPHPFTLFVGVLCVVAVASTVVAAFGVEVRIPGEDEARSVNAALSATGLVTLMSGVVENFVTFPALGPVLLVALGVGVAQGTGALEAAVRLVFSRVRRGLVPYLVALVACQGNVMSDASFLVIPPLAALVFMAVGRHPVAGLIGAYGCIATGYAGGFLLGTLDASLSGITEQAAETVPAGDDFAANIAMNYYYGIAAGLLLATVGGFLIDRVLEPRLGTWQLPEGEVGGKVEVTTAERRALRWSVLAVLIFVLALVVAFLLPGSPLQGEDGTLIPSPLLDHLVVVIFALFLIFGFVYSRVLPMAKDERQVGVLMQESMKNMSSFIMLIFIVSQTLAVLEYSNLGAWIAVALSNVAESAGIQGFGALLILVVISSTLNLLITSGSGLWSLEATVMVPALMLLGLSPAIIQAAHRIGDSITQGISPMHIFLYLTLTMTRRYMPEMQLGTLVRRLLPFVPAFGLVWVLILGTFYFLDIPPGPGQSIFLE